MVNNIQSTSLTLTVDSGKKMTLVFEEATPFGLKIFVTVSIFSNFLMYIQIPSQQKGRTKQLLSSQISSSFPLAWRCRTRRKRPDAPLKADSQVPLPRPAPVDVEGSDLDGIFVSKM